MTSSDQVLLLDVDGVLVTPPDWFGLKIRREAPEVAAVFFDGPFLAATRGEVDLLDHLPAFTEALGRSCSSEEFLAEWHEYENLPNLQLWNAVHNVRQRFRGVYLATNQERHRTHYLMTKGGLGSLVDGEFASCTVGCRKPTQEYFEQVTRRLGVMPERITFFDDVEENVAAATKAGWTAHIFSDTPDFLRVLGV